MSSAWPLVLHVTPQLSLGGAGRALINLVRASNAIGGFEHRVISLSTAQAAAVAEVADAGAAVSPLNEWTTLVARAEILQVHFWNDPELSRFMNAALPARRLLLWAHVRGWTAPHLLTPDIIAQSTFVAASDPGTLALPDLKRHHREKRLDLVPPGVDPTRLSGMSRKRSRRIRIGYLGSLDFAKLDSGFVSWCAAVRGSVLFVIAGEGPAEAALRREIRALGLEDRFRFLGFVRDIREFFAQIDILGHPLDAQSYAAGESCIQEAMTAGVPPVVLRGAGGSFHVRNRETGLVARDGRAYVKALESLVADPELRLRLGKAARAHARAHLTAETCARRFHDVYAQVLTRPKETHRSLGGETRGAESFAASLGPWARPFRQSLRGGRGSMAADRTIAKSSDNLLNARAGGLLHYRLVHPEDLHLRLWSGLVFEERGRFALAASEFAAALHGLGDNRAVAYLARVTARARG